MFSVKNIGQLKNCDVIDIQHMELLCYAKKFMVCFIKRTELVFNLKGNQELRI